MVCDDSSYTTHKCIDVHIILMCALTHLYCVFVCLGIDTLLTTLRSLNEKVGTYDEEEEFKLLEELLQSSRFQKAKSVCTVCDDVLHSCIGLTVN